MSIHPADCACGPDWRAPKPNGACAACGGWLPGERLRSLTAMWRGESAKPAREPREFVIRRTIDNRYEDSSGGEWWPSGPPDTTPITDEMASTIHNRLRADHWNDLHSWDESGPDTQQTVRTALDAALNGGER